MKKVLDAVKRKLFTVAAAGTTMALTAVPAFAAGSSAPDSGTLDPELFDPLVSGITGNISAVLPKVIVVVALLVGLGVVIGLVKKHARPS
ncbi:hypothetical protein B5F11_20870 [Anaerotruncus colihominis]|uniref:Uncharacterized protein n=1 Tax=Anaerotruncus colihominis TaxID=169435 RepID=A0A1Y4M065_9FIRM|nr:hypothetical protein [Anaerotruncus colihominis]OUP62226.1 hypothetical protein B5F11_20870 [Anaerotruncus colihominis]